MNDALLRTAQGLQQAGRLADAERAYGDILRAQPRNLQALYVLGHLNFGRGRFNEAERLFAEAAKVNPQSADAHFARGCALQRLNRNDVAADSFAKVLSLEPKHVDALVNRAVALLQLGRPEEALASFDKALSLAPARAELWLAHGNVLAALRRFEEAAASYGKATAINPALAEAWNNRGTALYTLGRFAEAVASYDAVLKTGTRNETLLINRGLALAALKRHAEALASFDLVLSLAPSRADALYYRGTALIGLQRYAEALASLDLALAAAAGSANTLVARGIALKELGRVEEALSSYAKAIAVKPDGLEAFVNREAILFALKRYEEAASDCEKALTIDPEAPYVRGDLLYYRLQCCDWRDIAEQTAAIATGLKDGKRAGQPFMNVALPGTAATQLQCARIWAESQIAPAAPLWRGERYAHERIRIAYISGDFREHPVAQLLAGVFERHDKSRFETVAVSLGIDDKSPLRGRVGNAVDRFADMQHRTDTEIAAFIRQNEIDIAVDLMGFTGKSRPGILAHRPAPVQAQYLGFPGTMGTGFIDYIFADRMVIPEDERAHYSERVVYLPDTYMPIDDTRCVSAQRPTRQGAGLPELGFVFCSFNNSYKFTPAIFDVWMRLLGAVPGSVLWLPDGGETAKRNLRSEAKSRGISPGRIVFASFVVHPEDHLARLSLADLFLDTLPCNAHSTASDALLAGVPLLTCRGSTFAGRVASSLLHAAGMPELVTNTFAEYEALALKLAHEPQTLAAIRAKLAANRGTAPLFNTAWFTSNLETAFTTMRDRAARSEAPASFAVPASQ